MASQNGFSLIEVVLAVAIIVLITGLGVPAFNQLRVRSDVTTTSSDLVSLIRRAQNLARAGSSDSNWGVYVEQDKATLFKGTSFDSRDQTADEVAVFQGGVMANSNQQFVFSKLWGFLLNAEGTQLASQPVTITLTDLVGDQGIVTVTPDGMTTKEL